jgi:hypothetical protein
MTDCWNNDGESDDDDDEDDDDENYGVILVILRDLKCAGHEARMVATNAGVVLIQ